MLVSTYLQIFAYGIIFYTQYFLLVPKLFFNKKRPVYFISSTILIIGLSIGTDILSRPPPERNPEMHPNERIRNEDIPQEPPKSLPLYNFLITSFMVSGFGLGLGFSKKLAENEKLRKESEREKINAELVFLKSQMNPHFFFNTMNNIYALVSAKSEDAPTAILKLSKLMRYMLYETQKGDTLLGQEIEFMKNYFELVKLRLSDKVNLNVHFPDSYAYIKIPPLLFIPFIENAIKHGVSYNEPSFINIRLKVKENVIDFSCINSNFEKESEPSDASGIGLENIKKRLALLFPDCHHLVIDQNSSTFSVVLNINLSQPI